MFVVTVIRLRPPAVIARSEATWLSSASAPISDWSSAAETMDRHAYARDDAERPTRTDLPKAVSQGRQALCPGNFQTSRAMKRALEVAHAQDNRLHRPHRPAAVNWLRQCSTPLRVTAPRRRSDLRKLLRPKARFLSFVTSPRLRRPASPQSVAPSAGRRLPSQLQRNCARRSGRERQTTILPLPRRVRSRQSSLRDRDRERSVES